MCISFEGDYVNGFKNGFGRLETETKIYEGFFR